MVKIGRYRLGQRLGAGSFATVWRGHDDDLDVDVAVKVLAENWASNDDVRNRFLAEARLLRKIQDERIVRVYDIGTAEDGRPYFVMDFANGGSLEDLRRNLVAPGRALRLCAEAARALEVLHRNGVIHRDVTPGNILLTHEGAETRVLLADLGVAKKMVGQQGATMTAGTPAYMALEQATGVGALDQRADIYSIAAVAYALLTGRPPFPVRTLPDLLARNPNVDPTPIADTIGAPPMLDQLFAAALSPQPGRRPQTAEVVATAFDQIADLLPGGETYTPRPLPPAGGAGPAQQSPAYTVGLGGPGSTPPSPSVGSGVQAPAEAAYPSPVAMVGSYGPIATPAETPASLLQSYLGPDSSYAPAKAKERHTGTFYLLLAIGAVLAFVLTLLATIALFG
ncbi:serine/threonine-protein kinase [Propionicicella superfundia]|uniref:serine/threonine-protein kinase n=1 Tax=Propionicicella superfundia TaxID=348582 RepID=UPI00048DD3B6|nr:serine/threonine-protein kinase [Propionicicella superfundia]